MRRVNLPEKKKLKLLYPKKKKKKKKKKEAGRVEYKKGEEGR